MPEALWAVTQSEDGSWHVWPVGDVRRHDLEEECWCMPFEDPQGGLLIHQAADGRR